jgi:hypothetical protein
MELPVSGLVVAGRRVRSSRKFGVTEYSPNARGCLFLFALYPSPGQHVSRLARRTFRYRSGVGRDCLPHGLTFALPSLPLLSF